MFFQPYCTSHKPIMAAVDTATITQAEDEEGAAAGEASETEATAAGEASSPTASREGKFNEKEIMSNCQSITYALI